MKNNLYKIFFITLICLVLQAPSFAVGEQTAPVSTSFSEAVQSVQTEQNEETLAHQAVNGTLENDVLQENTEEIKPITKEIKEQTKPRRSYVNIVFKFVLAMLWVFFSSVIIFVILLSYKKLILKGKPVTPTYESTEHTLDTPKNFKEAIKLFLDKTKWN